MHYLNQDQWFKVASTNTKTHQGVPAFQRMTIKQMPIIKISSSRSANAASSPTTLLMFAKKKQKKTCFVVFTLIWKYELALFCFFLFFYFFNFFLQICALLYAEPVPM